MSEGQMVPGGQEKQNQSYKGKKLSLGQKG